MKKIFTRFNEIEQLDFSEASIYLDACFIIKVLEDESSLRKKVNSLLAKWSRLNVDIFLSPFTASEVIHALLKRNIYSAIEMEYKKTNNMPMSNWEKMRYHTYPSSALLYHHVEERVLNQFIRAPRSSFIDVASLLKRVKNSCKDGELESLSFYYTHAVETFDALLKTWEHLGLTNIHILELSRDIYDNALVFIQSLLLETNDAFHFACAESLSTEDKETYFVTLDRDFITSFNNSNQFFSTNVIRIA